GVRGGRHGAFQCVRAGQCLAFAAVQARKLTISQPIHHPEGDTAMIPDPNDPASRQLAQALEQLSSRWGWFVALGVLLVALGLFALGHVVAATLVSVVFVGTLMLVGGVLQLVHAWRLKG